MKTVAVLNVVATIMSNVTVRKETTPRRRSVNSKSVSEEERINAGVAIHEHMDKCHKERVSVYSEQDLQALKLFNLGTKLEDLVRTGKVNELELKVPWELLAMDGMHDTVVIGVIDAVHLSNKNIVVEELKTHGKVTAEGYPVIDSRSMLSYRYQVLLYFVMLQTFLEGVRRSCPKIKACYVGVDISLKPISASVLEAIVPFETLEELYQKIEYIVQTEFKTVKVKSAKITHLSQTLTKRAITLDAANVIAYEEKQRLNVNSLKWHLQRIQPWTISSNKCRSRPRDGLLWKRR